MNHAPKSPSSQRFCGVFKAGALRELVSVYASSVLGLNLRDRAAATCLRLSGGLQCHSNPAEPPIASLRLILDHMAKGGRRARRRRRLLVDSRRRDLDRLRESKRSTIAPTDESFDDCSLRDADVRTLAQMAMVAINNKLHDIAFRQLCIKRRQHVQIICILHKLGIPFKRSNYTLEDIRRTSKSNIILKGC